MFCRRCCRPYQPRAGLGNDSKGSKQQELLPNEVQIYMCKVRALAYVSVCAGASLSACVLCPEHYAWCVYEPPVHLCLCICASLSPWPEKTTEGVWGGLPRNNPQVPASCLIPLSSPRWLCLPVGLVAYPQESFVWSPFLHKFI